MATTPKPEEPNAADGFGDYIVYVDESGDHCMEALDKTYPMFVLAFCIFKKTEYVERAAPMLQRLKFKWFGHDMVVLHEREIRKSTDEFQFMMNPVKRTAFMNDLSGMIESMPTTLIAVAIRKEKLKHRYVDKCPNPYHIALKYGLERVEKYWEARGQRHKLTHVIVERRGEKEDAELELEFRRICSTANYRQESFRLELKQAYKKVNSCGMQVADLVARPIGRHVLDPTQPNRAFEILREKFDRSATGKIDGYGLKCFP